MASLYSYIGTDVHQRLTRYSTSDVKRRITLGYPDQYAYRGFRLWNSRAVISAWTEDELSRGQTSSSEFSENWRSKLNFTLKVKVPRNKFNSHIMKAKSHWFEPKDLFGVTFNVNINGPLVIELDSSWLAIGLNKHTATALPRVINKPLHIQTNYKCSLISITDPEINGAREWIHNN